MGRNRNPISKPSLAQAVGPVQGNSALISKYGIHKINLHVFFCPGQSPFLMIFHYFGHIRWFYLSGNFVHNPISCSFLRFLMPAARNTCLLVPKGLLEHDLFSLTRSCRRNLLTLPLSQRVVVWLGSTKHLAPAWKAVFIILTIFDFDAFRRSSCLILCFYPSVKARPHPMVGNFQKLPINVELCELGFWR